MWQKIKKVWLWTVLITYPFFLIIVIAFLLLVIYVFLYEIIGK